MCKTIKLSMPSLLVIGLFITGCSQQPVNLAADPLAALADIQPAAIVKPTAVDAQIQDVVTPTRPHKMTKPVQRMAKPVQRPNRIKPIQRHNMMSPVQRRMIKPVQKQYTY
ncbi:MAG: hypothetical protein ACPG47_01710 [Leucothrix sp.]